MGRLLTHSLAMKISISLLAYFSTCTKMVHTLTVRKDQHNGKRRKGARKVRGASGFSDKVCRAAP